MFKPYTAIVVILGLSASVLLGCDGRNIDYARRMGVTPEEYASRKTEKVSYFSIWPELKSKDKVGRNSFSSSFSHVNANGGSKYLFFHFVYDFHRKKLAIKYQDPKNNYLPKSIVFEGECSDEDCSTLQFTFPITQFVKKSKIQLQINIDKARTSIFKSGGFNIDGQMEKIYISSLKNMESVNLTNIFIWHNSKKTKMLYTKTEPMVRNGNFYFMNFPYHTVGMDFDSINLLEDTTEYEDKKFVKRKLGIQVGLQDIINDVYTSYETELEVPWER